MLFKTLDQIRPHNVFRRAISPEGSAATMAEAKALEAATGVPFSVPQQTGSRTALTIEGLLRRHPMTADMINKMDLNRLQALEKYFNNVLKEVSPMDMGKEYAGQRAAQAYKWYVDDLVKQRSRMSRSMFGKLNAKARNKPIFKMDETRRAYERLIDEFTTPIYSPPKIIKQLTEYLDNLDDAGGLLTAREFQLGLANYGKGAKGKLQVIPGLDDKATDRYIAGEVFGAMKKDMEKAAAGNLYPEVAEVLKLVRDTYAFMSDKIDDATENVLSKYLQRFKKIEQVPGSKVSEKFTTKTWAPEQIRDTIMQLEKIDSMTAQGMRRVVLEDILEGARPAGADLQGLADVPLSPAKLVSRANNFDKHIRAAYAGDQAGYRAWRRGIKAAQIMADRAGTGGSPTAPLQWAMKLVATFTGSLKGITPGILAGQISELLGARRLAKLMMSADGRRFVPEVLKTGNSVKAVVAALGALQAIDQREDLISGARSLLPAQQEPAATPGQGPGF